MGKQADGREPNKGGREVRFSDLPPTRQALVRLCQTINYGSIEHLQVRDGDPVFCETTRVLIDRKLDSAEPTRLELSLADFVLCREARGLNDQLDGIGTGTIQSIEVRAGIPRRIIFERPPAAWFSPSFAT